jgi:hypothetical protein
MSVRHAHRRCQADGFPSRYPGLFQRHPALIAAVLLSRLLAAVGRRAHCRRWHQPNNANRLVQPVTVGLPAGRMGNPSPPYLSRPDTTVVWRRAARQGKPSQTRLTNLRGLWLELAKEDSVASMHKRLS